MICQFRFQNTDNLPVDVVEGSSEEQERTNTPAIPAGRRHRSFSGYSITQHRKTFSNDFSLGFLSYLPDFTFFAFLFNSISLEIPNLFSRFYSVPQSCR
jgi:hypothetical protein